MIDSTNNPNRKEAKEMEKHNIIFGIVSAVIISCFLFIGESSVLAESVLSAEEATQLFSGKTVEGINHKGVKQKSYFDPNGTIRAEKGKQGKWYFDNEGRRCVKMGNQSKAKCRFIVKDGDVYKAFKINNKGKRQQTGVMSRFMVGNIYDF